MTVSAKQEALENALVSFNFPAKYLIYPTTYGKSDAKFSIASKIPGELGGEVIDTHTRFMTYDEMNSYLRGWHDAKIDKF